MTGRWRRRESRIGFSFCLAWSGFRWRLSRNCKPTSQKGGIVIATRRLPSLAPGLMEAKSDTPRVQELARELFETSQQNTRLVRDEGTLGSTLAEMVTPDFATGAVAPAIGFVHRKLPPAEIYFVANTSNEPVETTATVRVTGLAGEWWNPFTGESSSVEGQDNGKTTNIPLRLAPYESRVIVFSKASGPAEKSRENGGREFAIDRHQLRLEGHIFRTPSDSSDGTASILDGR